MKAPKYAVNQYLIESDEQIRSIRTQQAAATAKAEAAFAALLAQVFRPAI